ncbi:RsmB/NOP family class I SAM-dependent RNA methyltransferase [Lichenihabitans psoromatis]|uniref:RsmB/NOP family class I SAM-dependent RNA methyltransferase n=1 Tax=Lichenihabitans psoromatis TaxID=2528642 RepID=UPI0010383EE7|nr:RsmB/NOP family class I SAM-dependent RNA methyltransferase [Lichenihabitans psoromatis]
MTPAARLSAAIDILTVMDLQRRPAPDCLKEWGIGHRFAGSKDRAAIASLVYDSLRVKASAAWLMDAETPRAILFGMLRDLRGFDVDTLAALATGEGHAPAALSDAERLRLTGATLDNAPDHVRGNYPEWLADAFTAAFGSDAAAEGRALAARAPLDLRVNMLKATREKALKALAHLGAEPTPRSDVGLRVPLGDDGRAPALSTEPSYLKGHVEIQDEGSQLVTRLSGAQAGQQVLDLCAGGGGKTLALAAIMGNKGQIYATDDDARRLAPIYDRIARADARNIQVRSPKREQDVVADLEGRCDLVLVDAPCTGTGTWRRHPDAKWRMRPGALAERLKDQDLVLSQACRFLKPGGRLAYITCSVLREENEDRIAHLLGERSDMSPVEVSTLTHAAGLDDLASVASRLGPGLRLTPHTTGTDGFYMAALVKA